MSTFTGHEDHSIGLGVASDMTSNYRASLGTGDSPIIGGYFGCDAINAILAQTGCVGIRYYYGLNESGTESVPVLILVGVDADGNDLYEGELAEIAITCPPVCGSSNSLNS